MPVFLRAPDANQLILTDYVILSVSEELAVSFPKNIADANQSDSKNENEVVKNTWNWKYRSKSGKNDEKIKISKYWNKTPWGFSREQWNWIFLEIYDIINYAKQPGRAIIGRNDVRNWKMTKMKNHTNSWRKPRKRNAGRFFKLHFKWQTDNE